MIPCPGKQDRPLTLIRENNESLDTLLVRDLTLFLEYSAMQEMRLKSNETLINTHIKTLQTLTVPTQCYAVEFNDRFVTISLLY